MEYDPVLAPIWQAGTEQRLSHRVIDNVSIGAAAKDILRPRGTVSLRRDGTLVYGLSSIHRRRTDELLEGSREAGRYLTKMFGAVSLNEGFVPDSQPQNLSANAAANSTFLSNDGNFNLSTMLGDMSERLLRGVREHASAYDSPKAAEDSTLDAIYDQSIDAVARGNNDENAEVEGDTSNILRNLLSDDDGFDNNDNFGANDGNDDDVPALGDITGLDDIGDLTMDVSGSPAPEEVNTPPANILGDLEVEIVGSENVDPTVPERRPRKTQKRRAGIVDEEIVLNISRAQSARATVGGTHLRKSKAINVEVLQDPLAGELDAFLDPANIAAAIKRRRLLGPDLENEDEEVMSDEQPALGMSSPYYDQGFGDDNHFSHDNDDFDNEELYSSGSQASELHTLFPHRTSANTSVDISNLMSSDSVEAAESAASIARETITDTLSSCSGICSFSDLAQTKHLKAAVFLQLLKMSTEGEAQCIQTRPYGEIAITAA